MAKLERKIALVTGASSGIGEATAERLAKAGYTVYGTSRRGTSVGIRSFHMLPLDVTRDASVEAAGGGGGGARPPPPPPPGGGGGAPAGGGGGRERGGGGGWETTK